jgi:two-component system, OmpR family, catabolic regulation response regulator CreB
VRVILRRQGKVQESKNATWFAVDADSARIRFCGTPLNLTRYEFLLLQHLLDQPGRIYARELLMDAIWRDALDTSDRTVDTHIKTLRAKLKAVRDDLDPIVTHRGMGYSVANGAGQ